VFVPEGKDVETTQYVNMDGIVKVLREEAQDSVSSDIEKFKQDIYRLKQENSNLIGKQEDYVIKLEKEHKTKIEKLKEQSKKEMGEFKDQSKLEKITLQDKIDGLQRVIDGSPLTEKEMIVKLEEKIKQLEKSNTILKDKLPFWKR
jgi:hypothetical protein